MLKGFVVHIGLNLEGGHYITYCKTSQKTWKKFDDAHPPEDMAEVSEDANKAYILHFKKVEKKKKEEGIESKKK